MSAQTTQTICLRPNSTRCGGGAYRRLAGAQPALASSSLRAVAPAAHAGRVETLSVAAGQRQWGSFEPESSTLTLHEAAEPRDSELLNFAAIQTILHGGTAYALAPEQMPEPAPLAAIFRYYSGEQNR